jgi:shikimate dehydrogenase
MQINGATRLFPIIGDPVTYVESPAQLTHTLADRGHDGVCVPLQVGEAGLGVLWRARPPHGT